MNNGEKRRHEFPELYAKATNGKTKYWKVEVLEDNNNNVYMIKNHGYANGTLTSDIKEITAGKNIGKANETTKWEQAISDAQSSWNSKLDKKYTESPTVDDVNNIVLPMLAHTYTKRKHNIEWPAYVQPKLDGIRCLVHLVNGKPVYTSRAGKEFTTLGHLDTTVIKLFKTVFPKDSYLDGELYIHGMTFQQITRLVKKYRPGETEQVEYHIYDNITSHDQAFSGRFVQKLPKYESGSLSDTKIKYVETLTAHTEKEMLTQHNNYISQGYEGIIIRNIGGFYLQDHRSKDLQKYKDFQDEEYEVVSVSEATGNDSGTAVFVCKTTDGKEFSVRPKGTREQRRAWYNASNEQIGKMLTVRYQMYTDDGVPRFPVGLGFKEDR